MTKSAIPDKSDRRWQYHSRSDAHSKAACWAIIFDLLDHCPLLREHAEKGRVGFGINHEMRDFRMNRKKNLDLVICTPLHPGEQKAPTFSDLVDIYGIGLTSEEATFLANFPVLSKTTVGSVLLALEAKACMTEHIKARPRLYDELSSSFQTILGDTKNAIAAGFVAINAADTFISPLRNQKVNEDAEIETSNHSQPSAATKVLEKIRELPRRSGEDDLGYDAIGVVFLNCRNDGSEITVEAKLTDGTEVDPILSYPSMIARISQIYASRFRML